MTLKIFFPFLIIVSFIFSGFINPSEKDRRHHIKYLDTIKACNPDELFLIVEEMPSYKGGFSQLEKDLNDRLNINKKITHIMVVTLSVNCRNEAFDFKVLRGINNKTDQEIIKKFKTLKNWESGYQRNKAVDCILNIALHIKKGKVKLTQ